MKAELSSVAYKRPDNHMINCFAHVSLWNHIFSAIQGLGLSPFACSHMACLLKLSPFLAHEWHHCWNSHYLSAHIGCTSWKALRFFLWFLKFSSFTRTYGAQFPELPSSSLLYIWCVCWNCLPFPVHRELGCWSFPLSPHTFAHLWCYVSWMHACILLQQFQILKNHID